MQGIARVAVANRVSAPVAVEDGHRSRFFIGVQFWRVMVRALQARLFLQSCAFLQLGT
ncbi:MAG: hypothetical protein PPHEINF_5280 [uncultured Paraburkholderia sp.]|nr:MAG: hypothetical protein PPHEINF_5280 [uncultured Paraburkholderia sp.]